MQVSLRYRKRVYIQKRITILPENAQRGHSAWKLHARQLFSKPFSLALVRQPVKRSTLVLPLIALLVMTVVTGCATSFAPSEASTSLTPGPRIEPEADEEAIRIQQLFIRGLTRALIDDHRQAIFLYEQAMQIDENQPAILHALAESHATIGDVEMALYYSQRAQRLNPSNRAYLMQHVESDL